MQYFVFQHRNCQAYFQGYTMTFCKNLSHRASGILPDPTNDSLTQATLRRSTSHISDTSPQQGDFHQWAKEIEFLSDEEVDEMSTFSVVCRSSKLTKSGKQGFRHCRLLTTDVRKIRVVERPCRARRFLERNARAPPVGRARHVCGTQKSLVTRVDTPASVDGRPPRTIRTAM